MKVPEPKNICLRALFTTKKNLVNAISPYCARCLQSYPLPLWLSAGVALHKGTCCLLSSWKPLAILLFNPRASCEHHLIMVNVLPGLQLRLLVPHYSSNCANCRRCYLLCHRLRIICDNSWQCSFKLTSFCCTMDSSCILQGPFIVSGIVKTSKMLYYIFL